MENINKESLTYEPASADTQRGESRLNNVKETLADKLKAAANAIQNKAGRGAQPNSAMSEYGSQASDLLNRSADYVRDMDLEQVKTNVQTEVRRNPGRSLLIAGAAGLILGALLRRR